MAIKAILVDDEPDSLSVLGKLLSEFCPQVQVCGTAQDVSTAFPLIQHNSPDVVFLDIQMPGGNGFSLLKRFEQVPFEIIFVTSYDKYAIEAIRMSALDYLLKPVEVPDLCAAVSRLQHVLTDKPDRHHLFRNMLNNYESSEAEKKITVHHKDEVRFLSLPGIIYLEAERNYTYLHSKEGKFTSSKNLGEFEDLLENYPQFIRISKRHIVNLEHVTRYSKGEPCLLTVAEKYCFEISRRKKNELLARLKNK